MSKSVIVLLSAFALLIVGMLSYFHYQWATYPETAFEKYTHISHYKVKSRLHKEYEIFIEAQIDPEDANNLLKLHQFRYGYNSINLRGQAIEDHLAQSENSWYYLEKNGHGQYGYLCICLSNDKRSVQVLENFGD